MTKVQTYDMKCGGVARSALLAHKSFTSKQSGTEVPADGDESCGIMRLSNCGVQCYEC